MLSEKIFNGTISYLKIIFLFGSLMCFVLMFFVGFDPWHSLDSMIWQDLYGQKVLPENCEKAFELPFLLFSWLSVLSMLMLYFISKYPLAQKQRWAFWCIVLIGIFWPGGAAIITYYAKAWSYFVSVGMMTVLFFPPVLLLYPYFRNQK